MSKKIVTITYEVPLEVASDLQEMERDGALDDLAECLATLEGRSGGRRRVPRLTCHDVVRPVTAAAHDHVASRGLDTPLRGV